MLKKLNDWRFNNWSKSRRKGQLRYIVRSTFTISFAIVLGVLLFTNQSQWGEFLLELSRIGIINVCIWLIGELLWVGY
ncbi:hypothetical protein [Photobacterium leiognathi]|uniref:hypothetical protein n=1 Tax=Photobacterium leiognathi TaxID=553611 RepID=UPI0027393B96|nr:hypothetical protein [Photobacterium leiognathi]